MTHHSVPAIGLAVAILVAAQAQAAGSLPPGAHRAQHMSAACDAAQLASWFERQRQLTDGDVDPQKPLALPRECAMDPAHSAQAEPSVIVTERAKEHAAAAPTRHAGPRG